MGAREGASRLFHNEGGAFIDMTAGSGLVSEGAVSSAYWLDHDGDGRLDLFVVTKEKSELFRGLEGGFFQVTELPGLAGAVGPIVSGPVMDAGDLGVPSASGSSSGMGVRAGDSIGGSARVEGVKATGGVIVRGPTLGGGTSLPLVSTIACASSINDQANPGTCLIASTTPTLGRLYPISSNLFVAVGGNVGIGTTSPSAKLEVAGTSRITDTLTLAPGGDTALDVSTGSIYKGGVLFIHTKGSSRNTALGLEALESVTIGFGANTASGYQALRSNTSGVGNTASGFQALFSNTTGSRNTASGFQALFSNTTGIWNTASGEYALRSNTTGIFNTASGEQALRFNTSGHSNTASGGGALRSNTTGYENTAIGASALEANTTGRANTASGALSLSLNTTGDLNTASGYLALTYNTTGSHNIGIGYLALGSNTIGSSNVACGSLALFANTIGYANTAIGGEALTSNTGSGNIALGTNAGIYLTTGDNNIAIGHPGVADEAQTIRIGDSATHSRAFIAGIHAVTTDVADAIPVLIDSAGQLGTVSSSRRFKNDIRDMGDLTERLLELRPVVFHYKQEQKLPNGGVVPLEYGLIAEEVAEVFPDLVVYDEEGKPFTVKYHLLSAMLLNEMKKQDERFEAQGEAHARELEELREGLDTQRDAQARELEELRGRLAALESRTPATLADGNR